MEIYDSMLHFTVLCCLSVLLEQVLVLIYNYTVSTRIAILYNMYTAIYILYRN